MDHPGDSSSIGEKSTDNDQEASIVATDEPAPGRTGRATAGSGDAGREGGELVDSDRSDLVLDAIDVQELDGSIFRAFGGEGFRPWGSWRRMHTILATNGGSYGLIGPRGAGKSWLMQRAVLEARRSGGIGLWFPSPSEYKPQPFLSALADNFANEIEGSFGRRRRRQFLEGSTSRLAGAATAVLAFVVFSIFPIFRGDTVTQLATSVAFAVGVTIILGLLLRLSEAVTDRGGLLAEADTLRERIRYSQTLKETGEAGVSAASGMLHFKSTRGRELVERPTTTSSLVYDFRALAARAAQVMSPGKVVIAIDELDKIADPERVRGLLRDVKAIFEIEGVHFFVSLSYEAARTLRLGGVVQHDEFNSSFYAVLELPPLSPEECAEMLAARSALSRSQRRGDLHGTPEYRRDRDDEAQLTRLNRWAEAEEYASLRGAPEAPKTAKRLLALEAVTGIQQRVEQLRWFEARQRVLARAIGVLAAGNARETVRLYASAAATGFAGSVSDGVGSAMRAIMLAEFREFRREAFAYTGNLPPAASKALDVMEPGPDTQNPAPQGYLSDDERTGLFRAVRDVERSSTLMDVANELARVTWNPVWAGEAWRTNLEEEWRRLLVRIYVAGYIADNPPLQEDEILLRLQNAIGYARESAAVGWLLVREPPFDAPTPSLR